MAHNRENRVQETADDAALSKLCVEAGVVAVDGGLGAGQRLWRALTPASTPPRPPHSSAVRMGYYADPFLSFFVRKAIRRSPLINRGYYARVSAVDTLLHRFISIARRTGDGRAQVVNLGAGMDTTFFRCYAELALSGGGVGSGASPPTDPPALLWMDVDFPEITARKVRAARRWACMCAQRHASRPPALHTPPNPSS